MFKYTLLFFLLVLTTVGRSQDPFMNYMCLESGALIEKVVTSATADGGMLVATLQEDECGVTRLDANGTILWAKTVRLTVDQDIMQLYTVGEIDDGPAFYLLARVDPIGTECESNGYWLVEVDEFHEVVFSNYYCHKYNSCGGSLPDHDGKLHRAENGSYLLSLPKNHNFTCMLGLAAGGDTLYCNMYADTPNSGGDFTGFESLLLNDGSVLLLNIVAGGLHLMRVAQTGAIIWSRTYLTGSENNMGTAAVQMENDSILVTGTHSITNTQYWGFVLQMDALGNVGWHRRFDFSDQDFIQTGFPTEITVNSAGESLIFLTHNFGANYLVQYSPGGSLTAAYTLHDENIMHPNDNYYRSFWPRINNSDRLTIAASVQYYGAPWWNDSILVAAVDHLNELPCGLIPIPAYDEPFPNQMPVEDNGAVRGDIWFRTGELPAEVLEQDWIVEPFCLTTSITQIALEPIWLQPTAVGQGDPVMVRSSIALGGVVNVLDPLGRLVHRYNAKGIQEVQIATAGLAASIYSVVLETQQGNRHLGRFVLVDQ